jgi:hypothetical protein
MTKLVVGAHTINDPCPYCGEAVELEKTPNLKHYGRFRCTVCKRHVQWAKKPRERGVRNIRRRDLVRDYSDGYCELCRIRTRDLPPNQRLEAHHIKEVQEGGTDDRSNVWIVCDSCHALIHHQRIYHSRLYHLAGLFEPVRAS